MKGVDAAQSLSAIAPKLKTSGVGFVCRYYGGSPAKDLTPAEAMNLANAGLRIVTVWEARGDRASAFSASSGVGDAGVALRQAEAVKQPPGSCIYFAVDFDASSGEMANVLAYFRSVNAVLSGKYVVGAYGSGGVLSDLSDAGLARYLWLAQSRGWRGTAGFGKAHIVQGPPATLFGVSVDTDNSVQDDFGSWTLGEQHQDQPGTVSTVPLEPSDDEVAGVIKDLQSLLAKRGFYKGAIDGIYGPMTAAALQAWEDA